MCSMSGATLTHPREPLTIESPTARPTSKGRNGARPADPGDTRAAPEASREALWYDGTSVASAARPLHSGMPTARRHRAQ
jgi:hypothetical protein